MIKKLLIPVLISIFPLCGVAEEAPCGVSITPEYNVGMSAAAFVGVDIIATNTLTEPVDAITWRMKSNKSGQVLFSETWVGAGQKAYFNINPSEVGLIKIGPGDTTALIPMSMFNKMEFLIRDGQGSDGTEMKEVFEIQLAEAKEKYADVSCEILGYVKNINF